MGNGSMSSTNQGDSNVNNESITDNKVSDIENNESEGTSKENIDTKKSVEQKNVMARPQYNSNSKQNLVSFGLMGGSVTIGLGALLFISKFKRKKRLK